MEIDEFESEDNAGQVEDFEGEEAEERPRRRPVWLRVIAFITALAFLGLVLIPLWPNQLLPLADLVNQSLRLKKDVDKSLLQAVVQINVISRRQGSAVSVDQKSGTGFNIDPGGIIITNHHVIDGALNVAITFPDGRVYKVDRLKSNPETDLAVIALQGDGLPVVPVNASKPPVPGDKIRVVGNPRTLNNILVEGHVRHYLRLQDRNGPVFSIDAPIFPGNSGSPVFNMNGQVVGVVFGSLQGEENAQEKVSGLAVTIDEAMKLIDYGISIQRSQ